MVQAKIDKVIRNLRKSSSKEPKFDLTVIQKKKDFLAAPKVRKINRGTRKLERNFLSQRINFYVDICQKEALKKS